MGSRLALIFTMLFTGEIIFGQTQSFTCEISFGPVIYPFYNYKNNENNGSYKAGGNLTYFISERAGFNCGLGFESKNFMIDYQNNNLNGWEIDKEYFEFRYRYLPLYFEIKFIDKEPNLLSITSGLELNRLLSKNRREFFYNGLVVSDNFNDMQIAKYINNFRLSLSYRYFFCNTFYINISPIIRFNISNSQGIHGNSGQGTAFSYVFEFAIGYKKNKV